MKFCAIDIETTGLDMENNDIIQFAAVLDDLRNPKPLEELPTFTAYFLRNTYRGEAYALAMHTEIFKTICDYRFGKADNQYGQHEVRFLVVEDLMYALGNWFGKNGVKEERGKYKINIAGKNPGAFDITWLRHHIPKDNWGQVVFRHRVTDPASHFLDPQVDDVPPDLALCMKRAGFPDEEVKHTALEDAMMVVKLLRKVFVRPSALPSPK